VRPGKFSPLTWIKAVIYSDLTQVQKLVAITLAMNANQDGTNAHPGRQGIADALGISIATVKRATKTLSGDNWIEKTSVGRQAVPRNYADVYRLLVQADHGSKASDHGSEPSDHGSQACTPTCSSTPAPLHLSDSDESGASAAAPLNLDRWSPLMVDLEALENWLNEELDGMSTEECRSADGMWGGGHHPKAILHAILKQRNVDHAYA